MPFRKRSHEILRIEAFSDAVFAFAVTLLIVALEVPHTWSDLWHRIEAFPAFAVSFVFLFHIWYLQYNFFRRYGLEDMTTIVLNAALLFVVLFFVYPLKFLATLLLSMVTGGHGQTHLPDGRVVNMVATGGEMQTMMVVYGLGYCAIYAVFALLSRHALRQREALELNAFEQFITRTAVSSHMVNICVGLLSISIVAIGGPNWSGWAGLTYCVIGPAQAVHGVLRGRQRRKLGLPEK